MTPTDFKLWLGFHLSRFPSMNAWLGKYPERANPGEVSQATILGVWMDRLKPVSEKEARDATQRIYEHKIPGPQPWDELPNDLMEMFVEHCKEYGYPSER